MKNILIAIALALGLSLSGCATVAKDFTARTVASVSPANGFAYDSSKNQESLKATGEMNKDGSIKFSVETTATTPEAAIAATLSAQAQTLNLINQLLDKVLAATSKVPVK